MYIHYGDTFFDQKIFPLFDACIRRIREFSTSAIDEVTLLNRLEESMQPLISNRHMIKKENHEISFRLGGKVHSLNHAESITEMSAEDINLWVAKFANHEQALRDLRLGNHLYTGRSAYKDSQRLIWVAWCMIAEGINSCFALFQLRSNKQTNNEAEISLIGVSA